MNMPKYLSFQSTSFRVLTQRVMMLLCILVLSLMPELSVIWAQDTTPVEEPATEPSTGDMAAESSSTVMPPSCTVSPIEVPTLPENIPGYTELDPDTQLHVTGTAQVIDLESYVLVISGKVTHPLTLAFDDLRCLPKVEARPTLVCPGFFQDTATWAGVPLSDVLEFAGVKDDATRLRLVSADGYTTSVALENALSDTNFLAYEWEGKPIPILHGFPVRAIFPDLQGNKWVKWLVKIEVE